jgi:hypothetical protein
VFIGTTEQAAEKVVAVGRNSRSLTPKGVRDDKNEGLSGTAEAVP